jgi:hypothetical protein
MAYEFDLEQDADPPFSDAMGIEIVEFVLGFNLDADTAIIMSVMLVPIDEAYDLRFGIREKSLIHNWKVTAPDYSMGAVANYIPKEHRDLVTKKLQEAIIALVTKVKPENVTMETFYPKVPAKALKKYDNVSFAMRDCSYMISDQFRDGTTHKDYWLFTKQM